METVDPTTRMEREVTPRPSAWSRTITVGGLPGTGTTTACRTLSGQSGLRYIYAGHIFRTLAEQHGMTLADFGAYAEQHPEIDRALDAQQEDLLKGPPLILEGRLSGFLAYRDRLPAFKVWFTCDPYERAKRLVERDGGDLERQMEATRRREESERRRYLEFYGFDINDLGAYDLVLDTTQLSRPEVVEALLREYRKSLRPRRWWRFGF